VGTDSASAQDGGPPMMWELIVAVLSFCLGFVLGTMHRFFQVEPIPQDLGGDWIGFCALCSCTVPVRIGNVTHLLCNKCREGPLFPDSPKEEARHE
jgi:hypothetical protein